MADITLLPSAKVPVVYDGDFTMTTEWYRFFWNIYGFTGTGAVPVDKGGTGLTTIGDHEIIIGNANSVFEPAVLRGFGVSVTYDPGYVNISIGASGVTPGTYGTASSVGQFTINEYGSITFAQNVPIAIAASQITSGQLPVLYGGTGASDAAGARANLSAAVLGTNNDITSMTAISGGISTPDFIAFDTTPETVPTTPGSLYWDSADGNQTLSLVMANGDAIQQIGEETYFRIKASAPITEGQVVMFTGTVGASGGLTGAPASGLTASTASYVMGVATHTLATNDWGYVTSFGLVRQINTTGGAEAWVDGQILYLDPTVAGGLTKTLPTAPAPKVQVCAVVHAASNGSLFVRPSFGGILGQYEGDVQVTTPANGDLLIRNQTAGTWVNAPLTPGAGISISNTAGAITIANTSPSSGGTVTSVAALTLGTTGTDLSSTVANSTTTPVITLNVPTASATNRGALSAADWTTFNNKQPAGAYLTAVTADAPLSGAGTSASHLAISQATTSTDGYLSSTDWNTFNSKQPAGTYVTSISIASSNGFTGTSSGGATPALTLATSVTGILKGNGTAISAATSGTDYAPATSGTSILYGNGAGGFSNVTVGSGLSFTGGTLASTSGGGSVTSVTLDTGSTGLTVSGGTTQTITSSGTFTVAGTLGVGYGGTGTATAFTAGSVVFAGASGIYSQDNAQFFWDDTNNRLGLGTTSPTVKLDIQGTGTDHLLRVLNTGSTASDDSILLIQTSGTGATNTISGLYFGDGDSQSVGQLRYNHSNNSMAFYTDASVRMTIDSTGDVGVNTITPNIAGWGKAFTLNGDAATNAAYELSFNGSLTGYLSYSSTDSTVNLFNFANADLTFGTNNTKRATVFASGGVSIGSNTDPGATNLLVAGSSTSASFIPSGSSVPTNGMYLSAANTVSWATASTQRLSINSTGLITIASGGGLSIASTAVTSPAASDGNVFSGTYTPSLTNTTNIAASTASVCQYMRVGNVITVSGTVAIDPTAAGRIVMGMSLPVASNFSGATNCGGTFVGSGVTTINLGAVIADATNDRATFDGVVADTANRTYGFSFTYRVI